MFRALIALVLAATSVNLNAQSKCQPTDVEVVIDGLAAFVETTRDGNGKPATLDALLLSAPGIGGAELPAVFATVWEHSFPHHEALIAVEKGKLNNCKFIGPAMSIELPDGCQKPIALEAYRLCDNINCDLRPFELDLGSSSGSPDLHLDDLVDMKDLNVSCNNPEFLRLDGGLAGADKDLVARFRFKRAKCSEARLLPNKSCKYPNFGFRMLTSGAELPLDVGVCPERVPGSLNNLAEEVAVFGVGEIGLPLRSSKNCKITPDDAGKIKLRLLNMAVSMSAHPHHQSFYYYYNLSSKSCLNGPWAFPRPCEVNGPAGDPKCPQIRLLE